MSLKWFLILTLLIILIFGAPIWVSLGAGAVASYHGCHLDEGGVYPCVINGMDYGHTLNVLFMLGWFSFVTLPAGLCALAILLGIAVVTWIVRFTRSGRPTPPASPAT